MRQRVSTGMKTGQYLNKPKKHYELSSIWIDGTSINIENAKDSYTFTNIQGKHDIRVKYTEIPSWAISTSVKNGTISDSIRKAYRAAAIRSSLKERKIMCFMKSKWMVYKWIKSSLRIRILLQISAVHTPYRLYTYGNISGYVPFWEQHLQHF